MSDDEMLYQCSLRMSKWLSQSKGFYNNLLANQEWLSTMASFGITAEMIAAGLEEIKAVESYGEGFSKLNIHSTKILKICLSAVVSKQLAITPARTF